MGIQSGVYTWRSGYSISMGHETMERLLEYINHGRHPGTFLANVICNKLGESFGSADLKNIALIPVLVGYLYNQAPQDCWGSEAKMHRYMTDKAAMRNAREEEDAGWTPVDMT